MPLWKALPEELDPQIREFASQLRGLVDRSGLNIDAVADRTGFSETSWERYLNGRLLPPRRAVVALADVTGTPQHHLTTMWEPAERAWSRAEMRHDTTIEANRISQAREALGAAGSAGRGFTATGTGGGHAPDGYGPDADRQDGHGSDAYGSDAYGSDAYGPYAYGPYAYGTDPHHPDPHRPDGRTPFVPTQRGTVPPVPQQRQGGRRADTRRGGGAPGRAADGRSNAITLAVGAAGAVIVVVGAVMLAPSGEEPAKATPPPTVAPTATPTTAEPAPEPPAGVECQGADCAGRNPDEMGCGGDHARTVSTAQVGAARVEVRFSEVCSAAWARLTEAGAGDTVTITGGAAADAQNGEVTVTEAYTPMVAVKKAADAKACATLTAGTKGCTT
ncbi:helix-turn-helix domain-containing protein [Streptomyces cyaneofuscatus]|uniref:helix-turn-helix domain-containing protein n=1 Tax=Streptomyces cyaneofuscatus TaxID=66883 RepID=UPI003797315A